MAKYDPLFTFLCRAPDERITMSFDEIESMVGPLPPAASERSAWWSNEAVRTRVHALAWLNAGREVESVDRAGRRVTFSAPGWRRGS